MDYLWSAMNERLIDLIKRLNDESFRKADAEIHIKVDGLQQKIEGHGNRAGYMFGIYAMISHIIKDSPFGFKEVLMMLEAIDDTYHANQINCESSEQLDVVEQILKHV